MALAFAHFHIEEFLRTLTMKKKLSLVLSIFLVFVFGRFDIDLKWTESDALSTAETSADIGGDAISIQIALQEQLGLKLKAAKARQEMIVVEDVQRPAPN